MFFWFVDNVYFNIFCFDLVVDVEFGLFCRVLESIMVVFFILRIKFVEMIDGFI